MLENDHSPPITNWILDPITSAIQFVVEEIKVIGLLKQSLLEMESGQQGRMIEAISLFHSGDEVKKELGLKIISEIDSHKIWSEELRSSDYVY